MRFVLRFLVALALIYAALLAGLAIAMRQPPETFGAIMAKLPPLTFMVLPFEPLWMKARAGHLNVGDPAPDFNLNQVRLSAFQGKKPVVLIFGSYT